MSDTAASGASVLDPSISTRSRAAAAILAFFVGVLGVHRFYVGKIGTGIAQILTLGGLGLWTLYDFIVIVIGKFQDKEGRTLTNW
ncbi:TM2 domain-containing protein [Cellulomonas chengniuliangii]|uniref:TM2 domain-containing protein n=1 Tax=Cellulomonas chengniuliangii TaxID=2968084 RepID=A0ABY5L1W6_9CELL|nr:TM2 domain-containing protein [Cellulomonas chengniuliangii]MCC2307772.1 TM2 domain-containing protein [Cellulomonas chengniuliangii]UUI75471.1 TM2 domain-containing protein [Cellulomonas chengniuliangii]